MPEHQIVFNLKPEQFEEAQRLARLSGAKSVSAFLKDRLLAFLGIELAQDYAAASKSAASAEVGNTINPLTDGDRLSPEQRLSAVKQDLNRIHRELQVFIAESLGSGIYAGQVNYDEELQEEPTLMEQTLTAFEQLQVEIERDLEEQRRALEESAAAANTTGGTTPARPADLSKLLASDKELPELSVHSGETTREPDYKRAIDYLQNAGVFNVSQAAGSLPVGQNQFGSGAVLPPFNPAPGQANETPSGTTSDELEDLAERAFAISPRLGSLGKPADHMHVSETPRRKAQDPDAAPAQATDQQSAKSASDASVSQNSAANQAPEQSSPAKMPGKPANWPPPPSPELSDPLSELIDESIFEQAAQLKSTYAPDEALSTDEAPPSAEGETDADFDENYDDEVVLLPFTDDMPIDSLAVQIQLVRKEADTRVADEQDDTATANPDDDQTAARTEADDKDEQESGKAAADDERAQPAGELQQTTNQGQSAQSADTSSALLAPPPKRQSTSPDSPGISGGPPPKKRKK